MHRPLGVVQGLGLVRIGQPGGQGPLVVLGQRDRVDERPVPVRGGQCQPVHGPGAAAPGAVDRHADPAGPGGVLVQPGGQLIGTRHRHLDFEAVLRPGHLTAGRAGRAHDAVREGAVQPVAQDPELERVEELVDLVPVPRHRPQVTGARLERDVPGQLGQLPVAQHRAEVLAELVPGLALDLVDPVHQLAQRAELGDPPGRGLLPHPRDVRQVVARVSAQRGEVRVLGRGQAVLGHDLLRGEPGHVADTAPGHQHRDVVVDQLQVVPVSADDEHVHARLGGRHGQRGDDVVSLVAGHRQPRDAEGVEHLEDQAELAAEVRRGLPPVRLVLHVLLVPEGRLAAVEGHRHVGRLLVAEHVDEHRGEAVDRVGGLPGRRGEVLGRQREERAVRQGMPVEQEQPLPALRWSGCGCGCLGRLRRHAGSLVACPDSGGPRRPDHRRTWVRPGGQSPGTGRRAADGPARSGFRSRGSRPARIVGQELNAKIVVDVNVCPGPSVVDGKDGSLGESGKCWVSKVYPAPCR